MLGNGEPVHCFGRVGIHLKGGLEKRLAIGKGAFHQGKAALNNVMERSLRLRFESSDKTSDNRLVT